MAEKPIPTKPSTSIVPPVVRANPAARRAGSKPANGKAAAGPVRKKAGWLAGFLAGLLLCALGAGVLGGLVWFDIAGLRTGLGTAVQLDKAEYLYLETKKSELAQAEAKLTEESRKLAGDQNDLAARQQAVAQSQTELAARSSELASQAASLTSQKASLAEVVSLYENMEPDKAAKILNAADNLEKQVPILKGIGKARLAQILAEMTPAQAARIVSLIAGE